MARRKRAAQPRTPAHAKKKKFAKRKPSKAKRAKRSRKVGLVEKFGRAFVDGAVKAVGYAAASAAVAKATKLFKKSDDA